MFASNRLRDVCIQDPRRQTAYLIPAEALEPYRISHPPVDCAGKFVTFTLTEDSLFDTVPLQQPIATTEPDIFIRDLDADTGYYIPFESLQPHEIKRPGDHPVAKTYTIPMPEALVEELPSAVRALLQTDFYTETPGGQRILRDSK